MPLGVGPRDVRLQHLLRLVEGGVLVHTVHWLRRGVRDAGDEPLVDLGPVNLGVRARHLHTLDIGKGEELSGVMPHGNEVWVQLLLLPLRPLLLLQLLGHLRVELVMRGDQIHA